MSNETKQDMQGAIEACVLCAMACEECAAEDIRHGTPETAECVLACLDCADVCRATATAMIRGSKQHARFCQLCAQLCRECEAHCAKHSAQHAHCLKCREACEACANQCAPHAVERAS